VAGPCVDGPRHARVFLRFGPPITCGHVSGLFARRKAAGHDGNRWIEI
jgi:hypothetical protein